MAATGSVAVGREMRPAVAAQKSYRMKVRVHGPYEAEERSFRVESLYFRVPAGVCFHWGSCIYSVHRGRGEHRVMMTCTSTSPTDDK